MIINILSMKLIQNNNQTKQISCWHKALSLQLLTSPDSCSEKSSTRTSNINCSSAGKVPGGCTGRAACILLFSFTALNAGTTFAGGSDSLHCCSGRVHSNHCKANYVTIFPSKYSWRFWGPFTIKVHWSAHSKWGGFYFLFRKLSN